MLRTEVFTNHAEAVAFAMKNRGWIDTQILERSGCEMKYIVSYTRKEDNKL